MAMSPVTVVPLWVRLSDTGAVLPPWVLGRLVAQRGVFDGAEGGEVGPLQPGGARQVVGDVEQLQVALAPVSYTHLDVYKRQR